MVDDTATLALWCGCGVGASIPLLTHKALKVNDYFESAMPLGKIIAECGSPAKNNLSDFELAQLQRIVSACLDMAELQAMRKIPMTMRDWAMTR